MLLFSDSDVFAGTECHILELAVSLHEVGIKARIACPEPSPLATGAGERGIDVVPIAKGRLIDWHAIKTLVHLLRSREVDLIHCHNGRTALQAALALKFAETGHCMMTQHFLQPARLSRRGWKKWLSDTLHIWVRRQMCHFVAISHSVARSMVDRGDALMSDISIVPNGISVLHPLDSSRIREIRHKLGVDESAQLIVSVARLEPEKDINNLIVAMSQIVKTNPSACCRVVGDGSLRDALQAKIDQLGLRDAVQLLGYRSDAVSIAGASDLFVLPSLAEPFGLAILEAMAMGKPVIATRAGGPIEIVDEEITGFLVPPEDSNALATAILTLLSDPARMRNMGNRGREKFNQQFTANRMASRMLEVYGSVLQSHPPFEISPATPVSPGAA